MISMLTEREAKLLKDDALNGQLFYSIKSPDIELVSYDGRRRYKVELFENGYLLLPIIEGNVTPINMVLGNDSNLNSRFAARVDSVLELVHSEAMERFYN